MDNEKLDNQELLATLVGALVALKDSKPQDRSDKARHFAVTITDLEKVIAYFKTYIHDEFGVTGF